MNGQADSNKRRQVESVEDGIRWLEDTLDLERKGEVDTQEGISRMIELAEATAGRIEAYESALKMLRGISRLK